MSENNSKDLCLSIKNYSQNLGLSAHLHNYVSFGNEIVEITGPLGSGLGIKQTGRHIAFAAGTGILPFIDLVAHLILRLKDFPYVVDNLDRSTAIDIDNFQFILYTSYATRSDVIGQELIDELLTLCRQYGK